MGQSQSTPSTGNSGPADSTKHVFTADTPINFSSELISSLQSSAETNSTRAKSLDLHIAQRVHEELAKLQAEQTSAVEAAKAQILKEADSQQSKQADSGKGGGSLKDKIAEKISGKDADKTKEQSSQSVLDEIERLKRELGQRKVLRELPKEVERAREGVVACLRVNDRRPLDCWKEVEVFKREVRRMEGEFVSKIL